MPETTSDTPELVAVSHPDGRTDTVPLDAALALEAQQTGWTRSTSAEIAQLKAEKAQLEDRIAELEAAAKADEADTKRGRKPAAAKADEADTTKSEED